MKFSNLENLHEPTGNSLTDTYWTTYSNTGTAKIGQQQFFSQHVKAVVSVPANGIVPASASRFLRDSTRALRDVRRSRASCARVTQPVRFSRRTTAHSSRDARTGQGSDGPGRRRGRCAAGSTERDSEGRTHRCNYAPRTRTKCTKGTPDSISSQKRLCM